MFSVFKLDLFVLILSATINHLYCSIFIEGVGVDMAALPGVAGYFPSDGHGDPDLGRRGNGRQFGSKSCAM